MELLYSDLNSRFDMCVIFTANYFSVVRDVSVDSEVLLVTDFVNLKIKLTQSFRDAYKNMIYMHAFIIVSAHKYMSIYISKALGGHCSHGKQDHATTTGTGATGRQD
jgi:hypothetical protein